MNTTRILNLWNTGRKELAREELMQLPEDKRTAVEIILDHKGSTHELNDKLREAGVLSPEFDPSPNHPPIDKDVSDEEKEQPE